MNICGNKHYEPVLVCCGFLKYTISYVAVKLVAVKLVAVKLIAVKLITVNLVALKVVAVRLGRCVSIASS